MPAARTAARRVDDEPAFILHSYDWSESSLILEAFTRHRGRITLIAKGAKKPTSNFRPVLLSLQPLLLSYAMSASTTSATPAPSNEATAPSDIHTLRGAQWAGGHVLPTGERLIGGLYLNELLMRLLPRDDPYAALFDTYAGVVQVLASPAPGPGPHSTSPYNAPPLGANPAPTPDLMQPLLRAFELTLLRELGLLPALDVQTASLTPLIPTAPYSLHPQDGLCPASTHPTAAPPGTTAPAPDAARATAATSATHTARPAQAFPPATLTGAQWLSLHRALHHAHRPSGGQATHSYPATLQACIPLAAALKPQLRQFLQHHCGPPLLRTRQLMMELQAL